MGATLSVFAEFNNINDKIHRNKNHNVDKKLELRAFRVKVTRVEATIFFSFFYIPIDWFPGSFFRQFPVSF